MDLHEEKIGNRNLKELETTAREERNKIAVSACIDFVRNYQRFKAKIENKGLATDY